MALKTKHKDRFILLKNNLILRVSNAKPRIHKFLNTKRSQITLLLSLYAFYFPAYVF